MSLRGKGLRGKLHRVLRSERIAPRMLRLGSIAAGVWAIIEFLDRFEVAQVPAGNVGIILFLLLVISIFEAVELVVMAGNRPDDAPRPTQPPEELFADSVLEYGRALSAGPGARDQTLLDLRRWTTRLLHLTGAHGHRQELGQLALTAAMSINDKVMQASILVDDLGWSVYEAGDEAAAEENIEMGIALLDHEIERGNSGEEVLELRIKAHRHLANIRARHMSITEARSLFRTPRELSASLPEPARSLNTAQIDHSEAAILLSHLDAILGPSGQVDPDGPSAILLQDAVRLAERAEAEFNRLGDVEREAKVVKLKVGVLAHSTRKQSYQQNVARLNRLEQIVARSLRDGGASEGLHSR